MLQVCSVYALPHSGRNATLHQSYPTTICVTSTPIYTTIHSIVVDNG